MDFEGLARKYAGRRHMQSLPSIAEEDIPPIASVTLAPRVRGVLLTAQKHLRDLGYEPNLFEYNPIELAPSSIVRTQAEMLAFSLSWKVMDPAGGHLRSNLVICIAEKPDNAIIVLTDGPGEEAEIVTADSSIELAQLTDLVAGAIDVMLSREERVAVAQADGLPVLQIHRSRP